MGEFFRKSYSQQSNVFFAFLYPSASALVSFFENGIPALAVAVGVLERAEGGSKESLGSCEVELLLRPI